MNQNVKKLEEKSTPNINKRLIHRAYRNEKGQLEFEVVEESQLIQKIQQTKVVFTRDPEDFERETNELTSQGWKISSTSCNNEFRAILIKG